MDQTMAELFAEEGAAVVILYQANKMGRHVKGRVLQVCNGTFL